MLQLTANILPHNPAILIIRNLCEADAAAACCRAVTVEGERGVVVEEVRLAFVVDDARVDGEHKDEGADEGGDAGEQLGEAH